MSMSEGERKEWEARFRAEAEDEDRRRQERHQEESRLRKKRVHEEDAEREAELAVLKQKVREQFWQEKGYVRYKDSRGLESWVTPDEMERRERARKARKKHARYEARWGGNFRQTLMFAGVLALAVVLGLVLGRS